MRPQVIKENDVRPIGARALKSAIDTLRPWLADSRVLDLYAGQGRFGLACLDEEAREVVFVEKDSKTSAALRKVTGRFVERARVETNDVLMFLERARAKENKFDIIFADPPFPIWNETFSKNLAGSVIQLMATNSIFLVKHPSRMVPSLRTYGFAEWKTTRFGESILIYFKSL